MASGMTTEPVLLASLDLAGTFTYALNGGLIAIHATRLDIVGVITMAMISGLGGGMIRDIILGALPPATFSDWRYLAVAAAGGLAAFALSRPLTKLATVIAVLDAAGLGLFAVTGASKSLGLGLATAPAIILGGITRVGGGTLRDALLGQVPSVFRRGLYAIPALLAADVTVAAIRTGTYGVPTGWLPRLPASPCGCSASVTTSTPMPPGTARNSPLELAPGAETTRSPGALWEAGRGCV